jgi:hypothetical protein
MYFVEWRMFSTIYITISSRVNGPSSTRMLRGPLERDRRKGRQTDLFRSLPNDRGAKVPLEEGLGERRRK